MSFIVVFVAVHAFNVTIARFIERLPIEGAEQRVPNAGSGKYWWDKVRPGQAVGEDRGEKDRGKKGRRGTTDSHLSVPGYTILVFNTNIILASLSLLSSSSPHFSS